MRAPTPTNPPRWLVWTMIVLAVATAGFLLGVFLEPLLP